MAVVWPDADGPIITYQGSRPRASRPLRPSFDPLRAPTALLNSVSMAAISAWGWGRIPSFWRAAWSRRPSSMAAAALRAASTRKIASAISRAPITAVMTTAGHLGRTSLKTSTAAQERPTKIAEKMYFSIVRPSSIQLIDPVDNRRHVAVQRDAQRDEHRDRHREDAQGDPQDRDLPARTHHRLVGRLARRRQAIGGVDLALDLWAHRIA